MQDLQNAGSYTVDASVITPAFNALCVNASRSELASIVYETFPQTPVNATYEDFRTAGGTVYTDTILDEFFDWNNSSSLYYPPSISRTLFSSITCRELTRIRLLQIPPTRKYSKIFVMHIYSLLLTEQIVNHTSYEWGRDKVYILGRHPEPEVTEDYFICSLKSFLTTACITRYSASASGRTLEAICDPDMTPIELGTSENLFEIVVPQWRDIGFDMLNSMQLNAGLNDGNASMTRTLTQLQLMQWNLNPQLPSPAEALLSMSTCTVLDLTRNFPFVSFWVCPTYS